MEEQNRPQYFGLGEIQRVAQHDPKLAYTLLQGCAQPGGFIDTGGWEILNLLGRFEDTVANQTVNGQLNGIVEADLWVKDVQYTVRRPDAFAGSLFKAQSDYFNAKNPNIDFTLTIKSFCEYVISPQNTPLENIRQVFSCVCPAGLVLRQAARIQATYTNNRALAADENPTEAIITLHAIRLPFNVYGNCDLRQAQEALRAAGIYAGA